MERFVALIVGGGAALVAGLWAATLLAGGTVPWALGVALALAGAGCLAEGVRRELSYGR